MRISIRRVTVILCLAWTVSVIYGEVIAYWIPYWKCSWPPLSSQNSTEWPAKDQRVKVAVIADPQLEDHTSHGLPSGTFSLKALEFLTDIYMRRSFRTSVLSFEPDAIIFLGDYFDGGPYLSNKEWEESANRFQHVFDQTQRGSKSRRTIPVYNISGNHDIGYSWLHSQRPEVVERYKQVFGRSNYRLTIGNIEFIAVDAQTLEQTLDGFSKDKFTSESWNFIKNISEESKSIPRVLLTHIPLYRPDGTQCGPYRSSPIINQRIKVGRYESAGIMYQNYLTEKTSEQLLNLLNPILVLSGHDHDQCTVSHHVLSEQVVEHTVGTFSWQQGNLYPSFLLLSVSSSSEESSQDGIFSSYLCFLPYQTHIYLWYASLFLITCVVLTSWPGNGVDVSYWFCKVKELLSSLLGSNLQGNTKEKDEDANYEYEMVWDAEGAMHLIKKTNSKTLATTSGSVHSGRGIAVIRTAAKKHTTHELDNSSLIIEAEMSSEQTSRSQKASKGKTGAVTKRILRTFFHMAVIASFNVPLYIMLLAKDWT